MAAAAKKEKSLSVNETFSPKSSFVWRSTLKEGKGPTAVLLFCGGNKVDPTVIMKEDDIRDRILKLSNLGGEKN